ncbi:MAG: sigma 54-interacting transcriptional regulator, partial [Desulfocapsaceae bacterium]|nr:sigma 54-interacting transcriptional regulator [Desulfocapsaceae bacterium]
VDCGALPETLLESIVFGHEKGAFTGADEKQTGLIVQADGGTLMLDEVGELPLPAQKAFLRTLQERVVRPLGGKREIPVDFRLVAATNQDLNAMVEKNLFREDLLYRIRTLEIQLPPLRERKEDIEEIVIKKLYELSKWYNLETKAISPEFIKILNSYDWPGNLRELINVLEYVLANAGNDPTLFPKHLPPEYRIIDLKFDAEKQGYSGIEKIDPTDFGDALPTLSTYRNTLEKNYLKRLINQSQGDHRAACQISGISRSRLYGLLKKHGLPSFTSL